MALRRLIDRFWRAVLRPASFVGKEMIQIRRQPQLIFAVIVAPFLVLLLFGIGYSGQASPLDTVLVLPPDSQLSTDEADYRDDFVYPLVLVAVSTDREAAVQALEDREIDVIVAFPPDAFETISSGRAAEIDVLFNELVPWQRDWLGFYSRVQTFEINKRVLTEVLQQGMGESQAGIEDLNQYPGELDAGLAEMEARLEQDDREGAIQESQALQELTRETMGSVRQSQRILLAAALSVGAVGAPESPPVQNLEAAGARVNEINTGLSNIEVLLRQGAAAEDIAGDMQYVREQRDAFAEIAGRLPAIPVDVLVSPFESAQENLAPTSPDFVEFYAPAVLALLIQHIAVSLTAMALVRERLRGTVEIFRVSPLSASEVLTGKYVAYLLQGALLSAILALTMVLGLGVPLLGDVLTFAAMLGVVLAASLGLGFLISAVVKTDTQAIQLAMILLLTAVFFSGFFLPLDNLHEGVRVVSCLLPVTYGIQGLQEIMLRGLEPPAWMFAGPAAMAVGFSLLAGIFLRLEFRSR